MIQDIAPHVLANEYRPTEAKDNDYILYYEKRKVLVSEKEGKLQFPTIRELEKWNPDLRDHLIYLFTVDDRGCYLAWEIAHPEEAGYQMEPVDCFRRLGPGELAFAGVTGLHLYGWYASNRYCGRCGAEMIPDQKERMMFCPHCHQMEFPKIAPAVIVAITDGDRIVLSQYAGREYKKYALIAGYAEIGETIEQTVRREVMEEVDLKVKNIRYYKSQPWGLSGTLLFGFFCELDGDDTITLDETELALAKWFHREEIPVADYDGISLTNEMILMFKNGTY